jgi:Spy/CpxP family protein refolding chaperone
MKASKKMVLLAVVLVFMVSTVFAVGPMNNRENFLASLFGKSGEIRHMVISALMNLNLSQTQKEEIRTLVKTAIKDNKELLKNVLTAKMALRETMQSDTLDEQAVREAVRKAQPYQEELAVVRAKTIAQIKTLLTPEQKQVLVQLKADIRGMIPGMLQELF